MKKYLLAVVVLNIFVLGMAAEASAQRIITGGYRSVPATDASVVAAAEFAVGKQVENNPEMEGLMLESINKAERQSVAGANYRICMTISLGEESQQVTVVVYQNLKQVYSLTSWEVVETCGESDAEENPSIAFTHESDQGLTVN